MTEPIVHRPDAAGRASTDDTAGLSPVDVALNLLWCVPGDVGGSEEYLVRQLIGLADQPPRFVPTIYCLPSFVDAHPDLAERYPVVTAGITGRHRTRRVVAEHVWLPRRAKRAAMFHHAGGTVPFGGRGPTVLTVHDLQYLTFPGYIPKVKLRYLRSVVPRSVARATVVATPTEYVRSTVVEAFDVDPDRVVVVRHGVEPAFGSAMPDEFELRRDYGLGAGRVLVMPGITHPHKGHVFLLRVMAERWNDPELRLVLLGGRGSADDAVGAEIDRLGLANRVVRPGRVPAAARDGLVALADALVFPSEYEGFGAPVVEAMALGTPVVCSDQPALAEIVGDAGLVLPRDVDEWGGALDRVDSRRRELVAAGRRRAATFTAEQSGQDLARAYALAFELGR